MFLAHLAGLTLCVVSACGGKLADEPTDGGEIDVTIESSSQTQLTCSRDSDCRGQCDDAQACCCDVASGTCFLPSSGRCEDTDSGSTGPGFGRGGGPI